MCQHIVADGFDMWLSRVFVQSNTRGTDTRTDAYLATAEGRGGKGPQTLSTVRQILKVSSTLASSAPQ